MIYTRYETCITRLANIEAIDYFLARELAEACQQENNELFFHLLLALHWFIRQGHSCLPVDAVAGRKFFAEPSVTESSATESTVTGSSPGEISGGVKALDGLGPARNKPGFTFPDNQSIHLCLACLGDQQQVKGPLVFEKDALFLRRYWQFECEVARALSPRRSFYPLRQSQLAWAKNIMATVFPPPQAASGRVSAENTHNSGTDWPKVAVANALGRNFSIITGGPGTGKTYTATRLLIALQATFGRFVLRKIILAAPTGKAAQRLLESVRNEKPRLHSQGVDTTLIQSIPDQAMTLHRLLGFRPHSVQPTYSRERLLDCDILLLDEVSMIDLPMLARLLRALPEQCRLIMLGDSEQLPSVEVGSILAELAGQQKICYQHQAAAQITALSGQKNLVQAERGVNDHVTRLTVSRRFSGAIKTLADLVIAGDSEASWNCLAAGCTADFTANLATDHKNASEAINQRYFEHQPDAQLSLFTLSFTAFEYWLQAICQHYYCAVLQAVSKDEAFAALKRFRILTPTRLGLRGVNRLNRAIEDSFVQAMGGYQVGNSYQDSNSYQVGINYKGRPIMVTENNYGVRLFNGDTGIIWPDENTGKLMAWFEEEAESDAANTDQTVTTKRYRSLSLSRLPATEAVYAMTIHKTQGSEFDHIAIVLPEQEMELLSRQLLYTGITRAKSHVYVVASEAIWLASVNSRAERYSRLGARLAEAI